MSESSDRPDAATPEGRAEPPAGGKARDPRAERLAAQLKANLKRRKAQQRGRASAVEE